MIHDFVLKRVGSDEAEKFFQLRMRALKTDPDSFVATMEEEKAMWPDGVQNYLKKNFVLGAFNEKNELIGTLVYMEQERQKFKHIGILGGMYVDTAYRSQGLGKKLLIKMLEELRTFDYLYSLQLKVITTNLPAIRLYESLGFFIWATEKNALLDNGKFFDQHHMMKKMSE